MAWSYNWINETKFNLLSKEQLLLEADKIISSLKAEIQTVRSQQQTEKINSGNVSILLKGYFRKMLQVSSL
jgi:hypothetical protein